MTRRSHREMKRDVERYLITVRRQVMDDRELEEGGR